MLYMFLELVLFLFLELVFLFDDFFEDGFFEEFSVDLNLEINLFIFLNLCLKIVLIFLKNFCVCCYFFIFWDNKYMVMRIIRKLLYCKKKEI